jgi:hypothetical protein
MARSQEVVALNVEDLEFCDKGVRAAIRCSNADQRGPGARPLLSCAAPARSVRCGGWEWLHGADITEGALFRQVPKGDKRVDTRLGGRACYEAFRRDVQSSLSDHWPIRAWDRCSTWSVRVGYS